MLSNSHTIPDLKEKIILLISNEVNKISSQAILARVSKIGAPTINKWLKHSYEKIGESDFKKLNKTYENIISEELWFQPITEFAQKLNLKWVSPQTPPIESPILNKIEGIDFDSRIKDRKMLQKTFEIMKGYWELYRYAISNSEKKHIVYSLLEIIKLNDDAYFECVLTEHEFYYSGYCFQAVGGLFFALEETNLINGTIFGVSNLPNTHEKPELNGVMIGLTGGYYSVLQIPAAARIALRYIGSIDKLKEKYSINSVNYSPRELNEKIKILINSENYLLSNNILDAIDNHVPQNAIPFALRADIKHDISTDNCKILAKLQNTLNNNSFCEVERKCLTDYLELLNNAICDGEYRFIKLLDYYKNMLYLVEKTNKNIIATYLHGDYDCKNIESINFTKDYLETQVKLIKEKNVSICRIFIIKNIEPDDFLLKKMHREEQEGIEVLYLHDKDWINASLKTGYIVDFAMFDEAKAIIFGEKEPFSSVQSASLVTNKTKINELIEFFNANKNRAKPLTDEMRQKAQML